MTEELRERVARAICKGDGWHGAHWRSYLDAADAVLALPELQEVLATAARVDERCREEIARTLGHSISTGTVRE